jgi:hypothetical protein
MLFGNVDFGGESDRDMIKDAGKRLCFGMPYFFDGTGIWDL